MMSPPALWMRFSYSGFYGLWSYDSWCTLPFLDSTDLESPAFAVIILFGVINTTLAVHPQLFEILFVELEPSKLFRIKLNCSSPDLLFISSSILLKVSTNASLYFCSLYSLHAFSSLTKFFSINRDTSGPESQPKGTSMPIKHRKQCITISDIKLTNACVFHVASPACV